MDFSSPEFAFSDHHHHSFEFNSLLFRDGIASSRREQFRSLATDCASLVWGASAESRFGNQQKFVPDLIADGCPKGVKWNGKYFQALQLQTFSQTE